MKIVTRLSFYKPVPGDMENRFSVPQWGSANRKESNREESTYPSRHCRHRGEFFNHERYEAHEILAAYQIPPCLQRGHSIVARAASKVPPARFVCSVELPIHERIAALRRHPGPTKAMWGPLAAALAELAGAQRC